MSFIHLLSYFLLNAEEIDSHAIFFPLYPYMLLILNSIYKNTFWLNQYLLLLNWSYFMNARCLSWYYLLLLFLLLFWSPCESKTFLNKLVFNGLIIILFRLVFFEINWSRGWSENVVSIWHICLINSTSKNTRWSSFT